jgi:hypothetical protein
MRRLVLATTVAVATTLGSIPTAPADGAWFDYGTGTVTCGKWAQQRPGGVAQAQIDEEWVMGFVSGVNYGRASAPSSPNSGLGSDTDGDSWAV